MQPPVYGLQNDTPILQTALLYVFCCLCTIIPRFFQCLFQVCQQIFNMFCPDREPDGSRGDVLRFQLLGRELRVCGGGRMDDQAFYIRNICQQGKDLQGVDKPPGSILSSFYLESEDAPTPVRKVVVVQRVAGMFRLRRMIYPFHIRMVTQELYDFQRIAYVTFYTEWECFQSLQEQERIEGSQCRPGIS